jgi:hypothetical protein
MPMIPIKAACCLISSGVHNSTDLRGHIDHTVKCAYCEAEYRIEYNPPDCVGVANFENVLIAAAQLRIDHNHAEQFLLDGHSPIISLETITH